MAKKEKIIPVQIIESSDESEISRPIEILDVLHVEPELTPKEVKLLQQVKCDKCNRNLGGFNDDINMLLKAIEHLKTTINL